MKKAFFLLTSLCLSSLAWASPANFDLEGTDITAAVQYFEKLVIRPANPISVYNWSANGQNGDAWAQGKAELWSETFWKSFGGTHGSYNMYGAGLYAAVDPVATYSYGGGGNNWLLIEMRLPTTFRMLDVGEFSKIYSPPEDAKKILKSFLCSEDGNPEPMFNSGGLRLNENCKKLVRKIFQDILKIDGIAYNYSGSHFKECSYNSYTHRAFVIMDKKWMKADSVSYYTSQTTGNKEGRTRIQTLFLKSVSDSRVSFNSYPGMKDAMLAPMLQYLKAHPESEMKSSQTKCESDFCVITVQFCDSKNQCDSVQLSPIPRPGGPNLTAAEAKRSGYHFGLLWSDLEGVAKTPEISTWVKSNKLGCSGQDPFVKDRP